MTCRVRYRSPVGVLSLEAEAQGMSGLSFLDRGPPRPGMSGQARAHLDLAVEALETYFAGRPPRLPPLALRGTPFQLAVWAALCAIPWGEVRSYGEVARLLGRAGCARAVGGANHENPVAILVPCHRVVQAGGKLGGYAAGLDAKRWLLAHEAGARPRAAPGMRAGPSRARAPARTLPCAGPAAVRSIEGPPRHQESRWRSSSR